MSVLIGIMIAGYFISMIFSPILVAKSMKLNSKVGITILSILNIVTFGLSGLAAQVLIIVDLVLQGYCDYSKEGLRGKYNGERHKAEKMSFVGRIVVYVIEFCMLFLIILKITSKAAKMSNGQLRRSYTVIQLTDIPVGGYGLMGMIIIGIVVIGIIMNGLVRDGRKTFYFDLFLQYALLIMMMVIYQTFNPENKLTETGPAIPAFTIASFAMLMIIMFNGFLSYRGDVVPAVKTNKDTVADYQSKTVSSEDDLRGNQK